MNLTLDSYTQRYLIKYLTMAVIYNLFFKLNLKKCEHTMIGNPEKNLKGISGGERKR